MVKIVVECGEAAAGTTVGTEDWGSHLAVAQGTGTEGNNGFSG